MLKAILKTTLGITLCLVAIGSIYYYFINPDFNFPIWYLSIPSVSFIGGVLLLYLASRSDSSFYPHVDLAPIPETPIEPEEKFEKRLEKNNGLIEDWERTNEKRDKLRLLNIAASAEKDAQNGV